MQAIDKGPLTKAVSSLGENDNQEVEQQVQKTTTEANPGDRVEANPSGLGEETLEKGLRKTEGSGETREDADADKVKSEADSSEGARIAGALTEEPEAQEQTEGQGRTDEAAKPPADPQSDSTPERQPSLRATPMYWRRFTTRYMATVAPTT